MGIVISAVEWDDGNLAKCTKHGVSLDEIEYVLMRETRYFTRDIRHSMTEGRYITTGKSRAGRSVFVAFTLRVANDGTMLMRPVSARYMHKREDRKYEKDAEENT